MGGVGGGGWQTEEGGPRRPGSLARACLRHQKNELFWTKLVRDGCRHVARHMTRLHYWSILVDIS